LESANAGSSPPASRLELDREATPLYVGRDCKDGIKTMRRPGLAIVMLVAAFASLVAHAQNGPLSVCDYAPPESRITSLGVQGSFSLYDGPYADDRARVLAASLAADYSGLDSSASFARQLDLRADLRGSTTTWSANVEGSGSVRTFWEGDLFGVGTIGVDASVASGVEVDLTAGVGKGRFRDVTPLAQAIRIQNALLDLGELLAPVANETLLDLARILGEVGLTDDERIVRIAERLELTDLTSGEELGVRALLKIETVLREAGAARLCGSDVQASLGAAAILLPEARLSATATILGRYALVPDPVSQVEARAELKTRLAALEQMSASAEISYARRLPEGWTARAAYSLDLDRMWTDAERTICGHTVSSSLTTKIFGDVGLSLVANAEYRTGDEEITFSIGVYVEASF
jgi:hypothetical protein